MEKSKLSVAETVSRLPRFTRARVSAALALAWWALLAGFALLIALQLAFFAVHAAHMLGYAFPLDYGEGPLLAQVNLLLHGTPIWRLYANPDLPPYAIVNYPPVYHLVTALLALPLGSPLLAGRLVSLLSTVAALAGLWRLSRGQGAGVRGQGSGHLVPHLLLVLAFLALPIVREWAVVMRVDMLGLALGLWALVIVQRHVGRNTVLWVALPLVLSLLVKQSLIAAPAAALLWLLFRDWRRALLLGALLVLGGGLAAGALQLGSGGWFALHVLLANANSWDRQLAYNFWHDQLIILWPLVAAAGASLLLQLLRGAGNSTTENTKRTEIERLGVPLAVRRQSSFLLPLYYTIFGAVVAYGVGKVGAYTNYFLEFYAGLIWLAASAFVRPLTTDHRRPITSHSPSVDRPKLSARRRLSVVGRPLQALVIVLLAAALLRYYPTWSQTYLKLAGIIEGSNPPRTIVGGYGVWQDLRRERDMLAALAGINQALDGEVRAAGAPIFTDVPGVAAQSGQLARIQAFEYRQLLDERLADQRPLLRDMANGRVPLVVLDYLGNWLTPEVIALIKHRYAQSGSRGTYDIYQPVDLGPALAANAAFPDGLQLTSYHLSAAPGRTAYHAGELLPLTLDWVQQSAVKDQESGVGEIDVVVQLRDSQGRVLLENVRPLLYGALAPADWGGQTMQHMQPLALPFDLPAATYQIAVTLRRAGQDLAPPQLLASLLVERPDGQAIGAGGYYVPAPLLAAWERLGGEGGPGDALMPATPLAGGTLQCFVRACLRLAGDQVAPLPLGEIMQLADVGLRQVADAAVVPALAGPFLDFWRAHGGAAALGPPITPELVRGDRIVQYTRFARLERPLAGGAVQLGRLGDEFLRLPGGVPYRWP